MTQREIDRIESAIRHIQTSTDIDPWATEIAVEAMRKQIPQKAMKSIDVYDKNLYKLYCSTCGALVANGNSRVGFMNKVSKWYDRCAKCGQVIDWKAAERTDHIAESGRMVERTAETAQKEACPVCGYKFQDCQCRFSGSAHPDRSMRAMVVADHIYLLTDAQIAHLAKVQEWWQISYDDEEMDRILEELKGNEKG